MTPGTPFSVPFSVKSYVLEGNFTVRATNSRLFDATYPTSLALKAGGSANGTVTITAPVNTTSGTDVTLTIEVEAPGGEDTNYAVLRFSVINLVKLLTPSVQTLYYVAVLITIILPGDRRHPAGVYADQPARHLPPKLQFLPVDALTPGDRRGRRDGRGKCDSKDWQRDLGHNLRRHDACVLQRVLLRAQSGAAGRGQGGEHGVLLVLALQQNSAVALRLPAHAGAGAPHEEMSADTLNPLHL